MAYSVFNKAHELGLVIGKNLAVVGFDGLPDSSLIYPALTTVSVQAGYLARSALKLLQGYLGDKQTPEKREVLPAKLVVRDSWGSEF